MMCTRRVRSETHLGSVQPPPSFAARPTRAEINRQHRKTGQVTYGNSYATHQAGYNPMLGNQALDGSDSDSDSGGKKGKKKPPPPPPPVATVYPPHGGMGYVPAPVPPVGFMPSPVPYGVSPVAMYPVAPWNSMPVSPVPMQVPEYIKKQVRSGRERERAREGERARRSNVCV